MNSSSRNSYRLTVGIAMAIHMSPRNIIVYHNSVIKKKKKF